VTNSDQSLIPDSKLQLLDGLGAAKELVRYILVRAPSHRPSVDDILKKLTRLQDFESQEAVFLGPAGTALEAYGVGLEGAAITEEAEAWREEELENSLVPEGR
jgi:hypothetical protein